MVSELIWEIIFLSTEDELNDGRLSDRFKKCQQHIAEALSSREVQQPPYILQFGGFKFEVLESLDECIKFPARSPKYTATICTVIHNMPPALLARDILMLLSQTESNKSTIESVANAIVLPTVERPNASDLTWRLLILWRETPKEFRNTAALHDLTEKITIVQLPIPGYEIQFQLQSFYGGCISTATPFTPTPKTNSEARAQTTTLQLQETEHIATSSPAPSEEMCFDFTDVHPEKERTELAMSSYRRPWGNQGGRGGRGGRGEGPRLAEGALVTSRTNRLGDEQDVGTLVRRDVLEEYIAQSITEGLRKQAAELETKLNTKLEDSEHKLLQKVQAQMDGSLRLAQEQALRQRAEFLASQITKYMKHKRRMELQLQMGIIPSPDHQLKMQELQLEYDSIAPAHQSITQEAQRLQIPLSQLGLPDFLMGPA